MKRIEACSCAIGTGMKWNVFMRHSAIVCRGELCAWTVVCAVGWNVPSGLGAKVLARSVPEVHVCF